MEYLNLSELKEREAVLRDWLVSAGGYHFNFPVVTAEWQYFKSKINDLQKSGQEVVEVNCSTDCYTMIKNKEL